jgi:hypothetical protein
MRRVKVSALPTALSCGALAFFLALGVLAVTPASHAQTADGMTPAEETVCDGQPGALWGLCVAYCEAMDCDSESPLADEQACERVLANYMKKSGGELPPCPPCLEMATDEEGGTCEGEGVPSHDEG